MDFLCDPVVKTLPSIAGDVGSIPGQGVNQNIRQKQYCNKCNKDFEKKSTSKNKQLILIKRKQEKKSQSVLQCGCAIYIPASAMVPVAPYAANSRCGQFTKD